MSAEAFLAAEQAAMSQFLEAQSKAVSGHGDNNGAENHRYDDQLADVLRRIRPSCVSSDHAAGATGTNTANTNAANFVERGDNGSMSSAAHVMAEQQIAARQIAATNPRQPAAAAGGPSSYSSVQNVAAEHGANNTSMASSASPAAAVSPQTSANMTATELMMTLAAAAELDSADSVGPELTPAVPSTGQNITFLAAQSAMGIGDHHQDSNSREAMVESLRQSVAKANDHQLALLNTMMTTVECEGRLNDELPPQGELPPRRRRVKARAPRPGHGCRRWSQSDAIDIFSPDEEDDYDESLFDISAESSHTSTRRGSISGKKRPSKDDLSVAGRFGRLGRHLLTTTRRRKMSRDGLDRHGSGLSINRRGKRRDSSFVGSTGALGMDGEDVEVKDEENGDWSNANMNASMNTSIDNIRPSASGMSLQRGNTTSASNGGSGMRNLLLQHANSAIANGSETTPSGPAGGTGTGTSMHDLLLQHASSVASMSGNGIGSNMRHDNASADSGSMDHGSSMRDILHKQGSARTSMRDQLQKQASTASLRDSMDEEATSNASLAGVVADARPSTPSLSGSASDFADLMNSSTNSISANLQDSKQQQNQNSAKDHFHNSSMSSIGSTDLASLSPCTNKRNLFDASGTAHDFIKMLEQPAVIEKPAASSSIQGSRSGLHFNISSTAATTSDGGLSSTNEDKKIHSIIGMSRGSTPAKSRAIKVTDNGHTASDKHGAQESINGGSDASPQELLVSTIKSRHGDITIRPSLSIEGKFHEHTAEEIASYPPTAMLVRNADFRGLKIAHESGTPLQTANKFGESLLHIACRRGYDDIAKFLVENCDVSIWVRDDFGRTPLHDACWTAHPNLELMDMLVRKSPELLLVTDKRENTPLDYVRREHWDLWRKFLEERWDIICPKAA